MRVCNEHGTNSNYCDCNSEGGGMIFKIKALLRKRRWDKYWHIQTGQNLVEFWDDLKNGREPRKI